MHYKSLTELIYVRLTVLIWVRNGLISISDLPKDAGDLLNEIYTKIEQEKPLIVDCKGVTNLIDHSWDLLFKSINILKREIVFINYTQLEEKIERSHKEFCSKLPLEKNSIALTISMEKFIFNISALNKIDNFIHINFSNTILKSFTKHKDGEKRLLPSTPFFANGEYNANKILCMQYDFIWTCIYFADFIQKIIEKEKVGTLNKPLRLLSVSLRGTPIAASVSILLNIPLLTVEYLGPQRNPINSHGYIRGSGYELLYIGDFSFAGTEIRITKIFASFNNSIMNYAFVLGSLLPDNSFTDFRLHSLVNLKDINEEAEYDLFNNQQ